MHRGAYGERLGLAFRLEHPPTLVSRTQGGHHLAVTQLQSSGNADGSDHGMSTPLATEEAYLACLHLSHFQRREVWPAGPSVQAQPFVTGATCILDLKRHPASDLAGAFDLLAFYVPKAALGEVGGDMRTDGITELSCDPQVMVEDAVIASIGHALLPMLRSGLAVNQSFVDHMLLALVSHLMSNYGGPALHPHAQPRSGLAPWQQRKAKKLLDENVTQGIGADDLARACGLSSSAFVRGFKKSTGLTPHQWLLHRRVDRAKELMRGDALPLSQVALSAGFADQSHFTRVFAQRVGASPGVWRRAHAAALTALSARQAYHQS